MKKKLLLCILASTLIIGGCGASNNSKLDKEPTSKNETVKAIDQVEKTKEPLDLTGTWKSENNEGSWMEATIADNVININWVSDNGDTKSIYWIGTYTAPKEYSEEYSWTSERDKEQTDSALLASTDDTKEFSYKDGELTYEASALGTTNTMHLTRTE